MAIVKTCKQCNHKWISRTPNPIRCPHCKSTRWDFNVIKHTCKRCKFTWTQRGTSAPRYCPSCHSAMWAEEKKLFTCPKCGRTRMLRANSRDNMCPFCDKYGSKDKVEVRSEFRGTTLTAPISLWSNNEGMVLIYSPNSGGFATLYEKGALISTVNIDFWFRTHSYTPENAIAHIDNPSLQRELALLAKQAYSSRDKHISQVDSISESRDLSKDCSEILALYDSGMNPTAISLKLNIPFSTVFDCINDVPRIHNKKHHIEGDAEN